MKKEELIPSLGLILVQLCISEMTAEKVKKYLFIKNNIYIYIRM